MILLYSSVLLLLGAIKTLVACRAASLGRKYSALSKEVQPRLRAVTIRPGNAGYDACKAAKAQLELGVVVQRRDQVEAKHFAWQHRADKLERLLNRLRAWKGQKLPYSLGAIDVWLALALIDHAGVGEFVSVRRLFDAAMSLVGQP